MIEGLLQPTHLILLLVIVMIVFGAGKLPDTMRELGRATRGFRDEMEGKTTTPAPATATPAPAIAASTVTCASCGKTSAVGAKFCASCGKAL